MEIAIRADGGPEIGYGHLVRTGALASELLASGDGVTYVTTTPESVEKVCPDPCSVVTLETRRNAEDFLSALNRDPDATVIDSYVADATYQRAVREVSPLIVLSDTERTVCADILVNGNLYASELSYDTVGEDPELCLGTDYVLLRDQITTLAASGPPWREQVERAIVVMGGSDSARMTPTVVRAFDGTRLSVDAVVGPGCTEGQHREVEAAADDVHPPVTIHRDPPDIPRLLFEADIGVSTASTTTYELLALGTPIVSIPVVENQERIASALDERDLATVLLRTQTTEEIYGAIAEYVSDSSMRRTRRDNGRALVDGYGSRRVADRIRALVT